MDYYDVLADLLESIGHFLNRLKIYTEVPPTDAMNDMIVKILVELLSTLALATKEIKRGIFSEFVVGERIYYLIHEMQKNLFGSFSARRKWRRWSRDWIGSRLEECARPPHVAQGIHGDSL
jgi:hypothetical protein